MKTQTETHYFGKTKEYWRAKRLQTQIQELETRIQSELKAYDCRQDWIQKYRQELRELKIKQLGL